MQKLILKIAQESRDHASALFDTSLGEAANSEVVAAKSRGTEYNNLTFGKSGHQQGPPFIWIIGGWLGDMLQQILDADKDKYDKDFLELTKQAVERYAALPIEGKAEVVKFFRITPTYKKRGAPEIVRITMSFAPTNDGQQLRALCIRFLKEVRNFEMKIRRAPPGHLEREIQEWLELMKD